MRPRALCSYQERPGSPPGGTGPSLGGPQPLPKAACGPAWRSLVGLPSGKGLSSPYSKPPSNLRVSHSTQLVLDPQDAGLVSRNTGFQSQKEAPLLCTAFSVSDFIRGQSLKARPTGVSRKVSGDQDQLRGSVSGPQCGKRCHTLHTSCVNVCMLTHFMGKCLYVYTFYG